VKPTTAVVDLACCVVDHLVQVTIINSRRYKVATEPPTRCLKGYQAVEPTDGPPNHKHRMKRRWLKGGADAGHPALCAARFDSR
jgi:hypothetical protein